ncbi:MAG: hypothetical protein VX727_07635 [Planctomycetota bacterium]|nr:hypothetical protein [Planctomycetota bacterium]
MKTTHACAALAATFALGSTVLGTVIQSESFENYTVGSGAFTDADTTSHWLSNYDDHTVVGDNWTVWFEDTGGSGFSDGDYFGVTNYTGGGIGAYTDGDQGYQMGDTDGLVIMTFEAVAGATGVSLDLFVRSTGWEDTDLISISFGGTSLIDTTGADIDNDYADLEGAWTSLSAEGSGELVISFASNASSETIAIDNIQWTGIPAPGALALLGLAGLASRRRRH